MSFKVALKPLDQTHGDKNMDEHGRNIMFSESRGISDVSFRHANEDVDKREDGGQIDLRKTKSPNQTEIVPLRAEGAPRSSLVPEPTPKGPKVDKDTKIGKDDKPKMKLTITDKGILGELPTKRELLERSQKMRSNSRHSSLHGSIR